MWPHTWDVMAALQHGQSLTAYFAVDVQPCPSERGLWKTGRDPRLVVVPAIVLVLFAVGTGVFVALTAKN